MFSAEKKWQRFQNFRRGFRMTISKLDRGGKKRERKVFSASPKVALITLFFWIE